MKKYWDKCPLCDSESEVDSLTPESPKTGTDVNCTNEDCGAVGEVKRMEEDDHFCYWHC